MTPRLSIQKGLAATRLVALVALVHVDSLHNEQQVYIQNWCRCRTNSMPRALCRGWCGTNLVPSLVSAYFPLSRERLIDRPRLPPGCRDEHHEIHQYRTDFPEELCRRGMIGCGQLRPNIEVPNHHFPSASKRIPAWRTMMPRNILSRHTSNKATLINSPTLKPK